MGERGNIPGDAANFVGGMASVTYLRDGYDPAIARTKA